MRDGDDPPRGRALTGLLAAKGSFTTTGLERQHVGGSASGRSRSSPGGRASHVARRAAIVAGSVSGRTERERVRRLGVSRRGGVDRDVAARGPGGASGPRSGRGRPALKAVVESFDDDGLTLRYATPPSEGWTVHLALGGSASGEVGWITSPSPQHRSRHEASPSPLVLLVPAPTESGVVVRDLAIGFGAEGTQGRAVAGYFCRDRDVPGGPRARSGAMWHASTGRRATASVRCYLRVEGVHARSPPTYRLRRREYGTRGSAFDRRLSCSSPGG